MPQGNREELKRELDFRIEHIDMLIREKDRQSLIKIFSEIPQPIEIWAYGSRVNGDAHDGSDLDLLIRSVDLKPLPYRLYQKIVDLIYDSTIPILVEIGDWAMLPESFHKQILKKHEVLYSSL